MSNTIYNHAFDVVHTDLWGPSPHPSSNGYSYYIDFIDAFSKYTWLYLLKNKSDALNAFELSQNYVTTQLNLTIKVVQSDFEGEFRSFINYLKELGIVCMLTCPYS